MKMHNMRKAWAIVAAACSLFAARNLCADTYTDTSGVEWTYTASETSAVITGVANASGTVDIPTTLGGVPVTGFGNIFKGNTDIVNITIPAAVETLEYSAFEDCSHLKTITFAEGSKLNTIGDWSVKNCKDLESFTMPDTVTWVGMNAFGHDSSLKTIHISNSLVTMAGPGYLGSVNGSTPSTYNYRDNYGTALPATGYYDCGVFANCTALTAVTGGASLSAIPPLTFYGCSALPTITLSDTVKTVGYHAFIGCSSLKSVALGSGVTTIRRGAFTNCGNLISVGGGSALESIEALAFSGCTSFKTIVLPATLKSIGDLAFQNCSESLTTFTFPTNAEGRNLDLGMGILRGCSNLKTVTLGNSVKTIPGPGYLGTTNGSTPDRYNYRDNFSTAVPAVGYYDYGTFANCTSLTTINWGSSVTKIGDAAFYGCSAIRSVTIPDTVEEIGFHAFYGCTSLVSAKIGNGVRFIRRGAFNDNAKLANVTCGNSVELVGAFAFCDCTNLKPFALPDTLEWIGNFAFANCSANLTTFAIPTNKYGSDITVGTAAFKGCTALKEITLGDSVTEIYGPTYLGTSNGSTPGAYDYRDDYATAVPATGYYDYGLFANCTALTTINWGAYVTKIGAAAFYGCSALTSVTIPDTVESIGAHAFYGCTKLDNVVVGDGVVSIGRGAFTYDRNLINVTCGANVETIGAFAFRHCENLKSFELPDTIKSIGNFAFAWCCNDFRTLEIKTNIYDDEVTIGLGAFDSCHVLKSVSLGDSVRVINGPGYLGTTNGSTPGYYNYRDTTAGVPSLGYIDVGVFCNCWALETIDFGSSLVTIGDLAFYNCDSLKHVTIPETVTTLGDHAFYECSSLRTVVVLGELAYMGRAVFGATPLHYVDFTATVAPVTWGANVMAGTKANAKIYAVADSTGWTGVTTDVGFPENGKWDGREMVARNARPENSDAAYDFYLYTPTSSDTKYAWPSPILLTTSRYMSNSTQPVALETVGEDATLYLSYAFDEYWRGEGFTVSNKFRLSGKKTAEFDLSATQAAFGTYGWLWSTNSVQESLQHLEPGDYTLTVLLNADNTYQETDEANNTASISFTVTEAYRTLTFDGNYGTVSGDASQTVRWDTTATLPGAYRSGYRFDGWWTAKSGGTQVTDETPITTSQTLYAHWTNNSSSVLLSAEICGSGSVTGADTYTMQDVATLVATPGDGYVFAYWMGDATGSDATTTVLMDGAKSVKAVFIPQDAAAKIGGGGGEGYYSAEQIHQMRVETPVIEVDRASNNVRVEIAFMECDSLETLDWHGADVNASVEVGTGDDKGKVWLDVKAPSNAAFYKVEMAK